MRSAGPIPAALLAALLAGCSATSPPVPGAPSPGAQGEHRAAPPRVANRNLSGFSAAFRQGYVEGCDSARSVDARQRDEGRYKSETDYMMGWNDGYSVCRR